MSYMSIEILQLADYSEGSEFQEHFSINIERSHKSYDDWPTRSSETHEEDDYTH